MKDPVKILFITQEIDPYLHETQIAEFCRKYPQFVQEHGCEIRIFMPCYGHINERRNQLHEVQRLSGMNIIIDDTDHPLIIKVASIQAAHMQVYFIDNEDYFSRKGISNGEDGSPFGDNDERAIFYARSVLETIKKLRWTPDIIHCCGWISSVAPIYIKRSYSSDPFFSNSKVVYSVFNDGFSGNIHSGFDRRILFDNIAEEDVKSLKGRSGDMSTMHRLAIDYSDAVVFGSDAISEDIKRYVKKAKVATVPCLPAEEQFQQVFDLYTALVPPKQDSAAE